MKTPALKVIYGIAAKDILVELRSRELISVMALFALLSIFIFSFALELDVVARQEAVSGVLWVTVSFACTLGVNRSLAMERDQGSFEALLMVPVERSALFLGKLAGNFLFALIVGLLLIPFMVVLYNLEVGQPDQVALLLAILLVGTLGLSTIGTMLATMTVRSKARETLLPIVMLPMALPIVVAAVKATAALLARSEFGAWSAWLSLLVVIAVIYFAASFLMFDFVVEE